MAPIADTVTRARIRPLPERVVNKIAAGEVVERPASALKELIENSLDAGATRVDIAVIDAGMTRMEIHDNGAGIPAEQIEIAFARHATSKISQFDDLEAVSTFGFRGEALPSIASVSRLRLITKTGDDDHATEIIVEGGVIRSVHPAQRAEGTSVVVEDLFFNTPARRKFLKSELSETRHILRTVGALALAARHAAMSLTINGRQSFAFDAERSLAERVAAFAGVSTKALVTITGERPGMRLTAAIGTPAVARGARGGLYFFVNNRALKASPLSYAVNLGYGELLASGQHPIGAVFLDVDSATVDVNVGPAKTEVRLSHEKDAHEFIRHTIKDGLSHAGVIADIVFPKPGAPPLSSTGEKQFRSASPDARAPYFPYVSAPPNVYTHEQVSSATRELFGAEPAPESLEHHPGASRDLAPRLTDTSPFAPGARFLGQFALVYLLAEIENELFMIDQHAAHERVLYERITSEIATTTALSQRMLFPVTIELSPERMRVYEAHAATFRELGFDIVGFGPSTLLAQSAPAWLGTRSPEKFIAQALDDLDGMLAAGYTPVKAVAQMMACRAAIKAGDPVNETTALAIVRDLFDCDTAYACPHGRPIFVKISRGELDRRFGRT